MSGTSHSAQLHLMICIRTYEYVRMVEPLYRGHHWNLLAVLYREVSAIQRCICTQLYVVGLQTVSSLESFPVFSVLYREGPLYTPTLHPTPTPPPPPGCTPLQNLHEIVAHQQRAKHLTAVKDGRYKMATSTAEQEAESRRQEERLRTLLSMADRLAEDFPHAAPALRRVHHLASWKVRECERSQQQSVSSSERTVELA